jgi:predicted membrane channel-forming protein YqfA (hemolysin III family)
MKKRKKNAIKLLDFLAILAFIASFTPLVIPSQQNHPFFMGIPYTMWMGFLVSVFFVLLTLLVSLTQKEENNAD